MNITNFADEDYSPPVDKAEKVIKHIRLDHLNPEEKEHALEIIREFPDNFYLPEEPLTPTHLVQHKIHILDDVPINTRPYRFSPSQREEVERVIDFRLLNEKAIVDAYPLPNIADILDRLGTAKYFSIFDLASGFHQIELDPNKNRIFIIEWTL